MKKLIILTGPTAVGKTELSVKLAKQIDGEIISADSIQVYKHMDIGSAKIKKEEMGGIKHYLIDEFNPDEPFNVHIFQQKAKQYIDEIYSKNKIPILVGGTGFYIQSVLYDIHFEDTGEDTLYRQQLESLAKEKGNQYLHHLLQEKDPESAKNIHYNNTKRIIRALEYYRDTGSPISEHNRIQRQNTSPYNFAYFVLNDDRKQLYSRINQRVETMINEGLYSEVEHLLSMGYGPDLVSMQGIGYKEMIMCIRGEITQKEAQELIQKNTRHFAKRQLTWFRREKDVIMLDYRHFQHDKSKLLDEMLMILKKRNIIKDN